MFPRRFLLALPPWLDSFPFDRVYPTDEARVNLTVLLAGHNSREGTGGPFGAAVFESATGKLVAPGVNLVVPARASAAHAEIVALTLAQQALGSHRLTGCELATSTEPCAMCLGAIPWSGVRRLLCGAREEDAREAGFDEGDKPPDWPAALASRGIEVRRDISREAARAVLRAYRGPRY